MTASAQPSKGWPSRVIIIESGKSRRWVVCRPFFRQYRLGAVAQGGPSSYERRVGTALHRALAEGAGADGGRQRRAAHSGNAAGWGHHSPNAKGNFHRRPGVCRLTVAARGWWAALVLGSGSS